MTEELVLTEAYDMIDSPTDLSRSSHDPKGSGHNAETDSQNAPNGAIRAGLMGVLHLTDRLQYSHFHNVHCALYTHTRRKKHDGSDVQKSRDAHQ